MSSKRHIELTVNGEARAVKVEPRVLLADALRHELGLTGTHVGCEQGACGACTVIIDDRAQRSCLMLAVQATDTTIQTIEGVAAGEIDHPVQTAMHTEHGLQCGFCTPGIVMSLVAAHRAGVSAEIAKTEVLGGHICRCTGYVNIRAAVDAAWADLDEST
ncbi:MAG: aerobic-type carbon monoxide dehydrogenase small subunit (CoxS/CutS family) [Verrucomicrobiales bacterium]|jgi:aerobic-type carbon monoxide dehydrogenase small subunit (CoxS/CutS family)